MRFVKPLDKEILLALADKMDLLVTLEENVLTGGFGSAVTEVLTDEGSHISVLRLGLPDRFIEQGTQVELLEEVGLLPEQISQKIIDRMNKD